MTWSELKLALESQGVTDDTRVVWVDCSSSYSLFNVGVGVLGYAIKGTGDPEGTETIAVSTASDIKHLLAL